jgi:hypothetical protein
MGAANATPRTTRMLGTVPFNPLSRMAIAFLLLLDAFYKIIN